MGRAARVGAPIAATSAVAAGLAIAVNLATEWKADPWTWVAVAVLTALSAVVSLWLHRRSSETGPGPGSGPEPGSGSTVSNTITGNVSGQTVQARDIHGPVTFRDEP